MFLKSSLFSLNLVTQNRKDYMYNCVPIVYLVVVICLKTYQGWVLETGGKIR